MTTELESDVNLRATIEEIIQRFQPIEHLFDVMARQTQEYRESLYGGGQK